MPVRALAIALLSLAGAPAGDAPDAGATRLQLVDAAEGCAEFWRRAPGAMAERQVRAFEQLLRSPHPTLYTSKVLGLAEPFSSSIPERLRTAARFVPDPARVDEVRRTLEGDLQDAAVQFRRTFPDFVSRRPVYVVCSLGAFDGGTRPVDGADVLLFGADVIAVIRPRGFDLRPFLEHELFHVHHGNLHPDAPETVAGALWEEGLATYVSAALNPGATNDEISVPNALMAEATPRIAELSRRLLAHLDDPEDGPTYKQFFYGSTEKATEVPPRSGYVIGWRIARELGQTHSLAELARMPPAESRAQVERALRRLAEAGDAGSLPSPDRRTDSER
ncbi:MAG: hypothetical protein ACXWLL_00195 [Myxococcaceae bacterium]